MKKKIMVVDDDPDYLLTVKQALKYMESEYKITCVSSGVQCIKLIENNEIPDLILLDVMMPEMNGWEVARKLRQNLKWRNIPIIFISAKGDKTSEITSLELAEEFIEKPFDIDDLKKRINKVWENSSNLKNSSVEY